MTLRVHLNTLGWLSRHWHDIDNGTNSLARRLRILFWALKALHRTRRERVERRVEHHTPARTNIFTIQVRAFLRNRAAHTKGTNQLSDTECQLLVHEVNADTSCRLCASIEAVSIHEATQKINPLLDGCAQVHLWNVLIVQHTKLTQLASVSLMCEGKMLSTIRVIVTLIQTDALRSEHILNVLLSSTNRNLRAI